MKFSFNIVIKMNEYKNKENAKTSSQRALISSLRLT